MALQLVIDWPSVRDHNWWHITKQLRLNSSWTAWCREFAVPQHTSVFRQNRAMYPIPVVLNDHMPDLTPHAVPGLPGCAKNGLLLWHAMLHAHRRANLFVQGNAPTRTLIRGDGLEDKCKLWHLNITFTNTTWVRSPYAPFDCFVGAVDEKNQVELALALQPLHPLINRLRAEGQHVSWVSDYGAIYVIMRGLALDEDAWSMCAPNKPGAHLTGTRGRLGGGPSGGPPASGMAGSLP